MLCPLRSHVYIYRYHTYTDIIARYKRYERFRRPDTLSLDRLDVTGPSPEPDAPQSARRGACGMRMARHPPSRLDDRSHGARTKAHPLRCSYYDLHAHAHAPHFALPDTVSLRGERALDEEKLFPFKSARLGLAAQLAQSQHGRAQPIGRRCCLQRPLHRRVVAAGDEGPDGE